MRTIKFRGKRVENGNWVYGFLVNESTIRVPKGLDYSVIPETVGQLVIEFFEPFYEGDIISQYNHDADETTVGELYFDEFEMRWEIGDSGKPLYKYHNPKVIGNIHDK